ncbi:MAG: hypothetical protein AAF628_19005 [Planctomycetota bacterium]
MLAQHAVRRGHGEGTVGVQRQRGRAVNAHDDVLQPRAPAQQEVVLEVVVRWAKLQIDAVIGAGEPHPTVALRRALEGEPHDGASTRLRRRERHLDGRRRDPRYDPADMTGKRTSAGHWPSFSTNATGRTGPLSAAPGR